MPVYTFEQCYANHFDSRIGFTSEFYLGSCRDPGYKPCFFDSSSGSERNNVSVKFSANDNSDNNCTRCR